MKPRQEVSIEHQFTRTNLAILHFLLTIPKWSWSLFFFLAARTISLPPPNEALNGPMSKLWALRDLESQTYQECTASSFAMLQLELQSARDKELHRVQKLQQDNQFTLDTARNLTTLCFDSMVKAQSILTLWQSSGNEVLLVDESSQCTAADRDYVLDTLTDNYQRRASEVTSIWDLYVQDTMALFLEMQHYAESRFHYDYDYFVGARIQPALHFLANLSKPEHPFDISVESLQVEEQLVQIFTKLHSILESTQHQIQTLAERLDVVSRSVQDFYTAYDNVYNRLLEGATFVTDLLPPGIPLPEIFQIDGLPIADSMLPSISSFDILEPDFAGTFLLLDHTAQLCHDILQNAITSLKSQSERILMGTAKTLRETVSDILSLEDYDPPVFLGANGTVSSLTAEVKALAGRSKSSLDRSKSLLDRMNAIEPIKLEHLSWNASLRGQGPSVTGNTSTFDYLRPTFPSFSLPTFLQGLMQWVSENLWILEVLVQALRLWQIETAYARGTVPDLPKITYCNRDEEAEQMNATRNVAMQTVRTVLAPRLLLPSVCASFFLLVALTWAPNLKANCIDTQSGTFLANHVFMPLLVNEANVIGNAKFFEVQQKCFALQRDICEKEQSQASMQLLVDSSNLENLHMDFQQSQNTINSFKHCIHNETSAQIDTACCGLKGHTECSLSSGSGYCPIDQNAIPVSSFHRFAAYLKDKCLEEQREVFTLSDALYDCDSLFATCLEIQCNGADKEALRAETVKADCEIEIYALHFLCFCLIVLYHGVIVHLASTLLFKGIRQLLWRRLCPESLHFSARLLEDGSLARGEDKDTRAAHLSLAIQRFELVGKLQILAGSLVLSIWVLSCYFVTFFGGFDSLVRLL